jgi:hypothetical protein
MLERTQTRRETLGPGLGGLGDLFAPNDSAATLVTVSHGPYSEALPVHDMTVAEIQARYRDRFDIDPHSQAVIDGNEVGNDTVVRAGQILLFTRRAGEKGRSGEPSRTCSGGPARLAGPTQRG